VIVVGRPDPRLVTTCADLGLTLVRVVPEPDAPGDHPWYRVVVDDGPLLDWLWRARTSAVLVRPDHVVQTREHLGRTDHGPGALLAERIREWADEVAWCAPGRVEAPKVGAQA
jgi:hypothetical protein